MGGYVRDRVACSLLRCEILVHGYHSGHQFGGFRWRIKTRVARVQRRSLARPSRRSVLPRRRRRRSAPTSLSTTRSVTEHDHRRAYLVHRLQSTRIPSGFRAPDVAEHAGGSWLMVSPVTRIEICPYVIEGNLDPRYVRPFRRPLNWEFSRNSILVAPRRESSETGSCIRRSRCGGIRRWPQPLRS